MYYLQEASFTRRICLQATDGKSVSITLLVIFPCVRGSWDISYLPYIFFALNQVKHFLNIFQQYQYIIWLCLSFLCCRIAFLVLTASPQSWQTNPGCPCKWIASMCLVTSDLPVAVFPHSIHLQSLSKVLSIIANIWRSRAANISENKMYLLEHNILEMAWKPTRSVYSYYGQIKM